MSAALHAVIKKRRPSPPATQVCSTGESTRLVATAHSPSCLARALARALAKALPPRHVTTAVSVCRRSALRILPDILISAPAHLRSLRPQLLGSFTVYTPEHYAALTAESADELVRINTSPLPSRLFAMAMPASSVPVDVTALDDAAVLEKATTDRAVSRRPIGASHTVDQLPTFSLHSQSWPQDRPIARALANNIGLC